jgi:hypothetical protein
MVDHFDIVPGLEKRLFKAMDVPLHRNRSLARPVGRPSS